VILYEPYGEFQSPKSGKFFIAAALLMGLAASPGSFNPLSRGNFFIACPYPLRVYAACFNPLSRGKFFYSTATFRPPPTETSRFNPLAKHPVKGKSGNLFIA
jgi:hypothetical protein